MKQYAVVFSRFLIAICRNLINELDTSVIPLVLNDTQRTPFTKLQGEHESIPDDTTHSAMPEAFHEAITSLWKHALHPHHRQWDERFMRCFVYSQLRHDGSFQNPRNGSTKALATLEFQAKS
jgi:hypothetical protein